jgi:hypothetical protein
MNSTNNINTNQINNSIVINLETLNLEYKNLLIRYEQAVLNYVNYLQQQSKTPCDMSNNQADQNCWEMIRGQAFWGTSGITQTNARSTNECAASCSRTSGCSGATYNPIQNTCILRRGEASTIVSPNTFAIVPKGQRLAQIIDRINERLTNINRQILNLIQRGQNQINSRLENSENHSDILINNYEKLTTERKQIAKMLNKYQETNQTLEIGNKIVTKNYLSFLLLLALVIIIIIVLFFMSFGRGETNTNNNTFQYGGKLNNNTYYIIFFMLFVSLLIHLIYNC